MSHPNTPYETDDGTVVHEFKPLPDRTPEEQVTALTQIVHQMSQNCFEVRLELNDLREENARNVSELRYLRSIVDETSRANYKTLTKN